MVDSSTPCPDCGRDMPIITWVGETPKCEVCLETGDDFVNKEYNTLSEIDKAVNQLLNETGMSRSKEIQQTARQMATLQD